MNIKKETLKKSLENSCPKCGFIVLEKWSGVKCSNPKCDYWFCF